MSWSGLVGVSLIDDEERGGKQLVGSLRLDPVQEFIKMITYGSYGITAHA